MPLRGKKYKRRIVAVKETDMGFTFYSSNASPNVVRRQLLKKKAFFTYP